ncbi:AAA+ ATPase [Trema orientale]|uniref:AAA+ ATPase n=1 Tax=Trema orientale TaxID=63057 RepID=A0A2P5C4J2_TREOI|nr:AAA+ ATPase [Trema orientale]
MEFLVSILSAAVAETGRLFFKCVYSNVTNGVTVNPGDLEKKMKDLLDLKNDVNRQLELAEEDGRLPLTQVKNWLRDVEALASKVAAHDFDDEDNNRRLCLSFSNRIRPSREMFEEAQTLLNAGSFPNGMVYGSSVYATSTVEYVPGPSIEDQPTASRSLDELVRVLDDEKYRRIGVWGMAGVGKTTLVKNLNNRLKSNVNGLEKPFSIVIWVTVSNDSDTKRVQMQMAERLNLEMKMGESTERSGGRLHQRLEKEERFLLILDDVWQSIDLDCLGVPQPETHRGSKIVLTTRSSDVCRQMMTDYELKVDSLSEEEAWKLFSKRAGEVVTLEHIKPFAEEVARECCGLPLAIVTVGSAMRGKPKVELWKHALKELRNSSVPRIKGVKDKVYNPLKWSYDSLQGDNIKACFLYCALFSEDFQIEVSELVQCWIAEGLIGEQQNFNDSIKDGVYFVAETLKDSCLLEDGGRGGTVRMHDVVRDFAKWIASSLEANSRSLIRSGNGLSEISREDLSQDHSLLRRVSFMNNKINRLPAADFEMPMQCPKASTLLLQHNVQLEIVPEKFLQGFQGLKVLNLGATGIRSLPPTLLRLVELRALLLRGCRFLQELPPLGALCRLQVLDLCRTRIKELPEEMIHLINLRQVNLSHTYVLEKFQAGVVSKWTHLEVLDMTHSGYHWGTTTEEVKEGQAALFELVRHKHLSCLSITLKSIPLWDAEYLLTWIGRLRRFQFTISQSESKSFPSRTSHDKRKVIANRFDVMKSEWIRWLLINASSLVWNESLDLNVMTGYLISDRVGGPSHSFDALKSLTITRSIGRLSGPHMTGYQCADLLPNLEELCLNDVKDLQTVSELVDHLWLLLSKLKLIQVSECPGMEYLFSCGTFSRPMPELEEIKVSSCKNLKMLFDYRFVVPNLRMLELHAIPGMKSLCIPGEPWPRLEKVDVIKCPQLTKLPLDMGNANTIEEIRGESTWWSSLMRDDIETKYMLQPFFKPSIHDDYGLIQKDLIRCDDEYSFIRRCYTP